MKKSLVIVCSLVSLFAVAADLVLVGDAVVVALAAR